MKRRFINLDKRTIKKNIINKDGKSEIKEEITYYISQKTKKNINKSRLNEINSRIKKTYIPKHLTNIQIAELPNNRVQIIGQDDAGRQQYFYAKEYAEKSESRKYKTLKNLSLIIQKLENENMRKCITLYKKLIKNRNYELTKHEVIELINYFLLYHHIRIGSKQYLEKYGSTGISTLKGSHFKFLNGKKTGRKCIITFKGKKGVINNCIITYRGNDNMSYNVNTNLNLENTENTENTENKTIKSDNREFDNRESDNREFDNRESDNNEITKDIHYFMYNILQIMKERKNNNDFMFDYTYHNPITNSYGQSIIDTNDYKNYFLDKYRIDITPKMFRTWFANYYLINYIVINNNCILIDIKNNNITKGSRKIYISNLRKDIINQISNNLNNTPEICKTKYINNKFLSNVLSRLELYCRKCNKLKHNNHLIQRKNIHNFLIKEIF